MLRMFRRRSTALEWTLPPGERVYAIGDIHGRNDLFHDMLARIDGDNIARATMPVRLVLLGDLINRGPQSAQVVESALQLDARWPTTIIKGNHEEVFLAAAEDRPGALAAFLAMGGAATLLSYGVDPAELARADRPALSRLLHDHVPDRHIAFLSKAMDLLKIGDFLFTHAGIRPGVALDAQRGRDLRWIRSPFLRSDRSHGAMIVHGHTVTDEPVVLPNRIGIDTGAYASGRLTAIGIEGDRRWFLTTGHSEDEPPARRQTSA